MNGPAIQALDRIPTGVEELDAVLNGGIPEKSITILAGEPGSGKTVLALQSLFHAARLGKRCIYFTTLSEPAVKVIRYMQLFGFFDQSLLDEKIDLVDLGYVLRSRGAEAALSEMVEKVEAAEPALVIMDSFKAIHDSIEPGRERTFVYDLSVTMAGWGATTLLVGEYTADEMTALPEFAVADGIIWLGAFRHELTMMRQLEVRKLRGSGFVSGRHFFDIDQSGFRFYPRVRAPEAIAYPSSPAGRVPTGTPGLDDLFRGGVPPATSNLVTGGTGTDKTILCLQFLLEGLRRGEPGVLLALEETPDQIRSTAGAFGWNLEQYENEGLLRILYRAPVELSTDRFLFEAREAISETEAKRVVLDSLTSLALGAPSEHRFKELVYSLGKHVRAAGATFFMTMEVPELLGTGQISGHGVSFASDSVIFMRYVEARGRLDRALVIIKARGIEHSSHLVKIFVGPGGLELRGHLDDLQGVLTGLPQRMR